MIVDILSAWRSLSHKRAFACVVVAEMALTIGGCTAVFSIVNAVLLRRLPYRDADRLVVIWHTQPNASSVVGMSPSDYQIYRETTHTFDSIAALSTRGCNLSEGPEPSRVVCGRVTSAALPMLGVTPLRGRWFTDLDDQRGAGRVVILSNNLWHTRMGAREDILGTRLTLDGDPYTVVGVMPPSFAFPPAGVPHLEMADCWLPVAFTATELATPSFDTVVMAKRKPSVSRALVDDDTATVARRIWDSYPVAVQKRVQLRARVVPLAEQVVATSRTAVLVFAFAAGCLLLLGCANVANLTLAHVQARQREMAIRTAIGATRWSLTRLLLIESVGLAVCGGSIGGALASAFLRLVVAMSPGNVSGLDQVHVDLAAWLFATACSVCAGLLCGVAPSLRVARSTIVGGTAGSRSSSSAGLGRDRLRSALVALELSMAVVLLVGAVLLLRSFIQLTSVALGFDPERVLTFTVELPKTTYERTAQIDNLVRDVLDRLHQIPSVTYAAAGSSLPLGVTDYTVISRPGAPPAAAGFQVAAIQAVSPEFHKTFGIDLRRGRLLNDADNGSALSVAVINETMARQFWPDTDPIGKSMQWVVAQRDLTIAGVVADVKQRGLASTAPPIFYIPAAQNLQTNRHLVFAVRSLNEPSLIAGSIHGIVANIDPALPVFGLQAAEDIVSQSTGTQRFNLFIVAIFAGAALILATCGLYAVISYIVGLSFREFGIRIALGATPGSIVRMIMIRGIRLVGLGVLVGMVAALAASRFISSLLFGVPPTDGFTFGTVSIALVTASLFAILVPALRATRVDPIMAVRQE
jgi:putative ABC transport system permease protein